MIIESSRKLRIHYLHDNSIKKNYIIEPFSKLTWSNFSIKKRSMSFMRFTSLYLYEYNIIDSISAKKWKKKKNLKSFHEVRCDYWAWVTWYNDSISNIPKLGKGKTNETYNSMRYSNETWKRKNKQANWPSVFLKNLPIYLWMTTFRGMNDAFIKGSTPVKIWIISRVSDMGFLARSISSLVPRLCSIRLWNRIDLYYFGCVTYNKVFCVSWSGTKPIDLPQVEKVHMKTQTRNGNLSQLITQEDLTFLLRLMFDCKRSVLPLVCPASKNLDQSQTFTDLSFPPEIMYFPLSPNSENDLNNLF